MADQTIPTVQQHQQPTIKPVADKIHVLVRNRTRVLFDADVRSLSSHNDTGKFDILPEHSNFISLITSPLILRAVDGKTHEIPFTKGMLKVKDNTIHCYIDLLAPEAAQ